MKILITWVAWFVGSNLLTRLIEEWNEVAWIDNFVLWQKKFIEKHLNNTKFSFYELDLLDLEWIKDKFVWIELVVHLAANSDISKWAIQTDIDLQIWTIATYNVLESMRLNNVKQIIFSSSSAVYWIAKVKPTTEDSWPLLPISLYWASKLACEWLISAFSHNYWIQAWIYRFGNVIWRNSSHWAAYDFVNKLIKDNSNLLILGNWKQSKPYIYVDDLIDWMLHWYNNSSEELNYFNLSTTWNSNVDNIANSIIKHCKLDNVNITYSWWEQWWRWDVTLVELDTSKITSIWWVPKYNSNEAVTQWTLDIVNQIYFNQV